MSNNIEHDKIRNIEKSIRYSRKRMATVVTMGSLGFSSFIFGFVDLTSMDESTSYNAKNDISSALNKLNEIDSANSSPQLDQARFILEGEKKRLESSSDYKNEGHRLTRDAMLVAGGMTFIAASGIAGIDGLKDRERRRKQAVGKYKQDKAISSLD